MKEKIQNKVALNKKHSFIYFIVIIILGLLVYSNSFQNGFLSLDDASKVTDNPLIASIGITNIIKIFSSFVFHAYMPLAIFSYAIDNSLWGLNPIAFHTINILLHVLNSILLFVFVKKLTGKEIAAFIAALIFTVHPMNVETVSWVSERSTLLYTLFFILSLFFYVKHINESKTKKYIYFSFLFFLLSVFSKPFAVTLPFALILIDYFNGIKINIKNILKKAPFFLISLAFGLIAIYATISTENLRDISSFNFLDRILMSSYSIAYYLINFFAPIKLNVLHPYPVKVNGLLPWEYYASVLFLAIIVFLIFRNKNFRKELIFGALFFLATASVFLTSTPSGGDFLVVEHFIYLPYIGFAIVSGLFFCNIFDCSINLKYSKKIAPYFLTIIIIAFSLIAYNRNFVWKDNKSIFTDMIKKTPEHPFGYFGLGSYKLDNKDYEGAIEEYNKAIKVDSTYFNAYYNRALAEIQLKHFDEAFADLNKTIYLNSKKIEAYNDRGNVRLKMKDTTGALLDYNIAINIDSKFPSSYYNIGNLNLNKKDYNEAIFQYSKAIELNNKFIDAFLNRGIAKYFLKDFQGSINDYNKVIELNEKYAIVYKNRGLSKIAIKDNDGACNDFNKAVTFGFESANYQIQKYCK